MTDSQQPPDKPFIPNYATPERPAASISFAVQVILGFVALFATGGVIVALAAALVSGPVQGPLGIIVPLGVYAPIVALAYLTYRAWRYWHWRGFLVGILIAIGLVGLGLGLCLAMLGIH